MVGPYLRNNTDLVCKQPVSLGAPSCTHYPPTHRASHIHHHQLVRALLSSTAPICTGEKAQCLQCLSSKMLGMFPPPFTLGGCIIRSRRKLWKLHSFFLPVPCPC